jgi:outer membrane protein TolC
LAIADSAAFGNRIADAQARGREAQALLPLGGILPSARVEASYLRTTDPLNSFGFILRQRAVTPAAFAPALLNDPEPRGNLGTGLVLEQPIFNADAWLGRRAANHAADAGRASSEWTRSGVATQVVRAYFGATLAAGQVGTLETALAAARAHVHQAEALAAQGMVTRADVLLAEVKAGQVEADLASARGNEVVARQSLAVLLGLGADAPVTVPPGLPAPDAIRTLGQSAAPVELEQRDDLKAARLAARAAREDAHRADALYLPRLNSFGRIDWNTEGAPFGGRNSWTVGVMLSWSPFSGGSELAERRLARSRGAEAAASADAARAQAALELTRTDQALASALTRLAITERAVGQSQEAHRIVGRKYEGGLASVTELFDAAAVETASELGFAAARYDAIVALAEGRRARGLALTPLTGLEGPADTEGQ